MNPKHVPRNTFKHMSSQQNDVGMLKIQFFDADQYDVGSLDSIGHLQ